MNTITDLDKFIGINQVIAKSIQLRMAVESVFNDRGYSIDKEKEFENLLTLKSEKNKLLKKRFRKVTKKLQKLSEPLIQAVQDSITEFRIDIAYDKCSDIEKKEKSQNNQLTWEASLAQHYAILLAINDINRFNDSINNLKEPLKNGDVIDLVNTIDLIIQFRDLFEKRERLESKNSEAKGNNPMNKQIDALYKLLEEQKTKKEKQTQTKSKLTGFGCKIDPPIVKKIFQLMVKKNQIGGRLKDFKAIFSKEPTKVEKPAIWLIKGQTTNKKRGNQMKLYFFLEKMLQRKLTNEDKRKASKLFVDEKGEFFNSSMRNPKKDERTMYDIFESQLKNILDNN